MHLNNGLTSAFLMTILSSSGCKIEIHEWIFDYKEVINHSLHEQLVFYKAYITPVIIDLFENEALDK